MGLNKNTRLGKSRTGVVFVQQLLVVEHSWKKVSFAKFGAIAGKSGCDNLIVVLNEVVGKCGDVVELTVVWG